MTSFARSRSTWTSAGAWASRVRIALLVLGALHPAGDAAANLVINGDFEAGNTGFVTTYGYMTSPAQNGAARYGINVNPRNLLAAWISMGDHTSGTGNMMVVNGSTVTGAAGFVWQSPANFAISPNTNYFFEAFVANTCCIATGAILTFQVFNVSTNNWDTLGSADLRGVTAGQWQAVSFTWNSGANTAARLRLLNAQPAAGGNDFVVDDIYFDGSTSIQPDIALGKSATVANPAGVGSFVTYQFLVTNTGDFALTGVTVTDPLPGLSAITCPSTTLAPRASMTCTASYTVTQADVDAGMLVNTATASGLPPGGQPAVTADDSATVQLSQQPGIGLQKTGNGPDPLTLNAAIGYSFVVTNTGNVSLSAVGVSDPLPGLSPLNCPSMLLAPNASMTCTASYTVTQADVDAGFIINTATASGQPAGGGVAVTASASETLPPSQFADISLDKTAVTQNPPTLGSTISYRFDVENTGNVSLSAVAVSDPLPGLSAVSCPATTLAPMASMTCTATYTVTQADVDAGTIDNTATVTAQPPGAQPAVSDTGSASIAPVAAPPTSPPGPPSGASSRGPLRVPAVPPIGLLLLTLLFAAAGWRATKTAGS